MDRCDIRDTGTRWSHQHFWTQLLPGTVPVGVDVLERYDAERAARHEQLRAAVRRGTTVPTHCPSCGHHLVATGGSARPDPVPEQLPAPLLDRQLPLVVMTRVVETLAGRRPVSQLAPLATADVLRCVLVEAHHARDARPVSLRTLHVQHVDDRAVELFGRILVGGRDLAFCARMELSRRGWRLTALRVLRGPSISTFDAVNALVDRTGRRWPGRRDRAAGTAACPSMPRRLHPTG